MDIFLENGHISKHGFKELIHGDVNELESLELSEHLSFCDDCLQNYIAILDDTPCLEPEHSIEKPVMKKIRHKNIFITIKKATTLVAAATIAMAFISTSYLSFSSNPHKNSNPKTEQSIPLSFQINQVASSVDDFLNQMVGYSNKSDKERIEPLKETS